MTVVNENVKQYKRKAAERAVEFIESGMIIGLGTGSTSEFAIRRIAELLDSGRLNGIVGIPSSLKTGEIATSLGVPLTTLDEHPLIDITIDGADEVDPDLNLIKGGGGALLREKILAQASQREIIVVDAGKLSARLGENWPVPVDVIPFGCRTAIVYLESLCPEVTLRQDDAGNPFKTDQGNFIVDCGLGPISDPRELEKDLNAHAGIVENGLFVGLATDVIVASGDGIRHMESSR